MIKISYPDFLEKSFDKNYKNTIDETEAEFNKVEIGKLNVANGKIIAGDPFTFYEPLPFTIDFPKGKFPVELAIADIATDERIGFARICFSDSKPVKWDLALVDGQDPKTLEEGEIFGYGVDSGTGCFMDTSGYKEFFKLTDTNEEYFNELFKEMDKSYKHTRSWMLWDSKGNNAAFFSTGYGDGQYQTYVGYDKDGKICRLVTDFGLIDWE